MDRVFVELEIANDEDLVMARRGRRDPDKIRRMTIRAVVDCGVMRMDLPQAVAKKLGLPVKKAKIRVQCADGRMALRAEVGGVRLQLQGRADVFSAVVEPKCETVRIGAIVLNDLDFLVDSVSQSLAPRDPDLVLVDL